MKKIVVWVVLLSAISTFNACKKDDPKPIPAIVGTWTLSKYQITGLKTGFTDLEGAETNVILGIEAGYTIVFKADETYTRAFTVQSGYVSINDKGKWVQDGTKITLSPDNPDDLDKIEAYGTVGTEFTLDTDITDIRLVMSQIDLVTLFLLPDDFPDDGTPTQEDFKPVDVTLHYKFNKL